MAEHLLLEGYKDASAVLLGAVREDTLRKVAESHSIKTTGPKGNNLTIDPLSNEIAKAGIFGPLVKKQITSWANLRNDAAHGHFDQYDEAQVKQMLMFVQKFCADYLQ
jgi:topoisomerase IA-like protein